jgi:dTDP-4-dehydrorhamnose reductase
MITILGSTGYIGSAFHNSLSAFDIQHIGLSRSHLDYTVPDILYKHLRDTKTTFLINAAGYTGKPNVDACEINKDKCLTGNISLVCAVKEACERADIPWAHLSSGCIYTGYKPSGNGYNESDKPNFTFSDNTGSFYSGTKALAEEALANSTKCYIWRLRIPFDHIPSPRNYLTKILTYNKLLNATNSLSHRYDFINACIKCYQNSLPYGIYNITNTGAISTVEIVEMIHRILKIDRDFDFFFSEDEFRKTVKTPRSNTVLDNSKIVSYGIDMPQVHEAVEKSLYKYQITV